MSGPRAGRRETLGEMSSAPSEQIERAASRYRGEEGRLYASWQLRVSAGTGEIVARQHFAREIRAQDRVLDFGCGGGRLLTALSCAERIGVEPNPASRETAGAKGIITHERLDSVPDASVDVVISNHALEHCLEPFTELCAIRRVLVPGGRLLLVLPVDDWRNQKRWDPGEVNHHLYGWTPLLIGHLLTEAGFRPTRIQLVHRSWPPFVVQLFRALPWPIFQAVLASWSWVRNHREMRAFAVADEL